MAERTPNPQRPGADRLQQWGIRLVDGLFGFPSDHFTWFLAGAWVVGLLLFGLYLWGIFFSWGNISFDFLDWAEITGPRYALLKSAMTQGVLPLHAANTTALRGVTDRFFSIADVPFSPMVLLLRYLPIERYIFLDMIVLYLAGSIGLVLLARRYRLSPFAFWILFLLFNFNGHITAHFAAGHANWTAYFLLPYFVLLVFKLLEEQKAGWMWVLGLALLLQLILMEGGFHLYLWCLIFLAVLLLFNWRLFRPVGLGGLFSVLLGLPRLLPPALALSGLNHPYLGGFATLTELVFNLFTLRDPDRAVALPSKIFPLSYWEVDFFIGLIGFALLVIFGVLLPLRREGLRRSPAGQILLACLVFSALSIGQIYGFLIKVFPLPPFTGERVTSRLFSLPLVFLITLAVVSIQREFDRRVKEGRPVPVPLKGVFLGLSLLLYHDLSQHLQAWRIRYLDGLTYLFPKVPFNVAEHVIRNHPDPLYIGLLAGGSAAALFGLAFLVAFALRERRRGRGAD